MLVLDSYDVAALPRHELTLLPRRRWLKKNLRSKKKVLLVLGAAQPKREHSTNAMDGNRRALPRRTIESRRMRLFTWSLSTMYEYGACLTRQSPHISSLCKPNLTMGILTLGPILHLSLLTFSNKKGRWLFQNSKDQMVPGLCVGRSVSHPRAARSPWLPVIRDRER